MEKAASAGEKRHEIIPLGLAAVPDRSLTSPGRSPQTAWTMPRDGPDDRRRRPARDGVPGCAPARLDPARYRGPAMNDDLECWRCGAAVGDLPLPLGRRAECRGCGAELHACRMCRHYDTTVARSCREPVAEEVSNKERANFCGWFMPRPNAYRPGNERAAADARAALDALFGGGASNSAGTATTPELEDLFRPRESDGDRKR
jgi:hypothetical protein